MALSAPERRPPPPREAGAAPLAVVVDARAIEGSGIGRYTRELVSRWLAHDGVAELTLLGDVETLAEFVDDHGGPGGPRVRVVAHDGGAYSVAAQRSWRRVAAEAERGDVAFFPRWDAPLVGMPAASVVTVHDLTQFRPGLGFGVVKRTVGARALRRVLDTAARVLCVSHATSRDLVAWHPPAAGKSSTVLNGGGERFAGAAPAAAAAPNSHSPPYLLWVGNLKPHKNVTVAIDVLRAARELAAPTLRLCVVGRAFAGRDVQALAAERGVADAVDVLGEVDDARLHALYARCAALVFPSYAEGFGLPVVEAMAAGAPVVASNVPAIADVVGDAAPVYDPRDVAGMAARAAALLADPSARAEAVERGRAQARGYTWDACAERTLGVLRDAAQSARRPR